MYLSFRRIDRQISHIQRMNRTLTRIEKTTRILLIRYTMY